MRPRNAGGTSVISVVISSGSMIAVPHAWMTRAPTSTPNPGARAATSVPSENSDMAAMNTCLVVKRWSRNPVIGMTTAIVSMNAVESHCAASASMWRSSMSFGRATLMIVSLRITTKVAASSSQITR